MRFLILITFLVTVDYTTAADWPNWRGPNHDGISQERLPEKFDSAETVWTTNVGIGFATVSVADKRALTMGNRDNHDIISCLDADSGDILWEVEYACPLDPRYYEGGPGGTPTIDLARKLIYTLSKKGHAVCLSLENGEVKWRRDLRKEYDLELPEWSFAGSPLISGDLVVLNVGDAGWALDCKSGKTVWRSGKKRSGYATPVPLDDSHLLIFSAKELVAIGRENGEVAWRHPWRSSRDVNAADPIVGPSGVLISSSAGAALLNCPPKGAAEVAWQDKKALRTYFNPGVLHHDHVYAIHGTTHGPTELICLDLKTGETVWSEGGFGSGGLMAASGGQDMILFDKGQLTIFRGSREKFVPRLRYQVMGGKCWTSPVFANGRIYCRNAAGKLASVRLK